MLCRAVPRLAVISLSCIADDNANKHIELARASMPSSILFSSVEPSLSIFFYGLFLLSTGVQQQQYSRYHTVVCTSMLSLSIRTASTAKHSAITPAQSSKPSPCRSEYVRQEVCTYMHAAYSLCSWSMELLAFASRLFAPKMLTIYLLHMPVIPIHSCL